MTQKTDVVLLAAGTDDEENFTTDHFGSSHNFLIYSFNLRTKEITFEKKIVNLTPEERQYGDPVKAKNISTLLDGISIAMAKRMGPNIERIRKTFIPILSNENQIKLSLTILPTLIPDILIELEKPSGTPKRILRLKLIK